MFLIKTRGFTLAEVMVSVSIVAFISAVVLFTYSTFRDNLALSAAGQEMAIAIRQAQTYGLTVKEAGVGGGNFAVPYGIYFSLDTPNNYYIFADLNGNKKYDVGSGCGSGSTECTETFSLRDGVQIYSLCDNVLCPPVVNTRALHVTFLRPNPDASIYFTNSGGGTLQGPSVTGKVLLRSLQGKDLTVTIETTGQISLQ